MREILASCHLRELPSIFKPTLTALLSTVDHTMAIHINSKSLPDWDQYPRLALNGQWPSPVQGPDIRNGIMPHLWGINLSHIYAREVM